MARIYVASSWRNAYYPEVVRVLREAGHEVYDFRNPPHGGNGFRWTDIDKNAPNWNFDQYAEGLHHPKAERQFQADLEALDWADTCVLVLPCGRSAHTEAGWMKGAGKKTIVYIPEMEEPELMYKLFDAVVDSLERILMELATPEPSADMMDAAVWMAYQDISDGMPKYQAMLLNNLTEAYYDQNLERVLNRFPEP